MSSLPDLISYLDAIKAKSTPAIWIKNILSRKLSDVDAEWLYTLDDVYPKLRAAALASQALAEAVANVEPLKISWPTSEGYLAQKETEDFVCTQIDTALAAYQQAIKEN